MLLEYVPGGGSAHSLAQVVALGVEGLEVTSREPFELHRGLPFTGLSQFLRSPYALFLYCSVASSLLAPCIRHAVPAVCLG